jgi:hypothetical protein
MMCLYVWFVWLRRVLSFNESGCDYACPVCDDESSMGKICAKLIYNRRGT